MHQGPGLAADAVHHLAGPEKEATSERKHLPGPGATGLPRGMDVNNAGTACVIAGRRLSAFEKPYGFISTFERFFYTPGMVLQRGFPAFALHPE
jgi:hypothetical protein